MRWFFLLGLPLGAQVGLPQGAHWVGLPLGAHPHLFWKLHFVCMIIIIIISIGQSVGRSVSQSVNRPVSVRQSQAISQ